MIDFAICAIIKNENKWLPEWLAYHRLLGCKRFYFYINEDV